MITEKPETEVWGIDGNLKGNEDRLMLCMPFVKFYADGAECLAAVRAANWSVYAGRHVLLFSSEEEAQNAGTRLSLDRRIGISDSQLIGVMGPVFRRNLKTVADVAAEVLIEEWELVQEEFLVKCLTVNQYEDLALKLSHLSKDFFDREMRALSGDKLTEQAMAALALLRGNSSTVFDAQCIRGLAAHWIRRDTDGYRTGLELGALRLDESVEKLKRWVDDYLALLGCPEYEKRRLSQEHIVVRHPADSLLSSLETSFSARTPSSEHPRMLFVPQKATRRGQREYVPAKRERAIFHDVVAPTWNGNKVEWGRALGACISHLKQETNPNEEEFCRIGDYVGRKIAEQELERSSPEEEFKDIWKGLEESRTDLSPAGRLMYAYVLKARTETLATSRWHLAQRHWKSLEMYMSKIHEKAERVTTEAMRLGIPRLRVAESQFPEDRLLAALLEQVMKQCEGITIEPIFLPYGFLRAHRGRRSVDFGLINEIAVQPSAYEDGSEIFLHTGYFAFANRSWLQDQFSNGAPDIVKNVIEEILRASPHDTVDEGKARKTDAQDLAARSWIVIVGGRHVFQNSEYRQIVQRLLLSAKRVDASTRVTTFPEREESFDNDFEDFLRGNVNAFMGGSVHAHLIKSWWQDCPDGFVDVLRPVHFEKLLEGLWPMSNRVVFGGKLVDYSGSKTGLKEAIKELYKGLSSLLFDVASDSTKVEKASSMLHHFMSILALSQKGEERHSRWSFVTHKADMLSLLRDDNLFLERGT